MRRAVPWTLGAAAALALLLAPASGSGAPAVAGPGAAPGSGPGSVAAPGTASANAVDATAATAAGGPGAAADVAISAPPEPSWVQTYTLPATGGPPAEPCAPAAVAAAPPPPPAADGKPAPARLSPPASEVAGMVPWDTAPGAANAHLPPEVRARLGVGAPFDVATIPPEPLRGSPADVARVRAVLAEAGRGPAPTRIAFWGASHVAGEWFTGEVRRVLQDRHGDAGHGFVMPAAPWKGYRATDVNLCTQGAWKADWHGRYGGSADGRYVPGGVSIEAATPESSGWVQTTVSNAHGRAVSRFEVLFLRQPGGGRVALAVDDAPPVEVATGAAAIGPGAAVLKVADGPHRLRVSPAGDGPVRILGVQMERDVPGVVVDAMGVSGKTAASWLGWDEALFAAYLGRRTPDLAVLAYGTNEANDRDLSDAGYRDELRAVLARMRRVLPDTPCVLIGPSDRGRKVKGTQHVIWGRTAPVAAVQREIGPEFGCATWDLQEATGGPGSMFRWQEAGLAAPDLIHFSADGYKELGRRFVAALEVTEG